MEIVTTPRKTVSSLVTGEASPTKSSSNYSSELWIITCDQHVRARYPKHARHTWGLTITFDPIHGVPMGSELTEQGIDELKSLLSQLHNLKRLEVDLPRIPKLAEYAMREILDAISNLYNLDFLTFKTGNIQPVCELGFKALSDALNSCSLLDTLILSFDHCEKGSKAFTKKNGQYVKEGLKQLKVLQHLELSFENSIRLADEFVSAALEALPELPHLKNLKLNLARSYGLTDDVFRSFAQITTTPFKCLQKMELILDECSEITTKGIKSFTSVFRKCNSLKDVSFSFASHSQVDDNTINVLKKNFWDLRGMKAFRLNLSESKGVDILGFLALRDLIVNFGDIRKIDLCLSKTTLNEQAFAALCGAFSVHGKLQELHLDISSSIHVGEIALGILKDCLAFIKSLKVFKFYIDSWDEELSDKGMVFVSEGLCKLKYLKKLDLSFANCTRISDDALKALKEAFKVFTGVTEIILNFEECADITKDGWSYLKDGLMKLSNIKILVLNFTKCLKLSDPFLGYLKDVLMNNKLCLEHLELYAAGCYQLSDKGLVSLKEGLVAQQKLAYCRFMYDDTHAAMLKGEKLKSIISRNLSQTQLHITSIHTPQPSITIDVNSPF